MMFRFVRAGNSKVAVSSGLARINHDAVIPSVSRGTWGLGWRLTRVWRAARTTKFLDYARNDISRIVIASLLRLRRFAAARALSFLCKSFGSSLMSSPAMIVLFA